MSRWQHPWLARADPQCLAAVLLIDMFAACVACAACDSSTEFSPEKPCEAVVTQNTLQVFHQCEAPDVWLVLTMRKGGKP